MLYLSRFMLIFLSVCVGEGRGDGVECRREVPVLWNALFLKFCSAMTLKTIGRFLGCF